MKSLSPSSEPQFQILSPEITMATMVTGFLCIFPMIMQIHIFSFFFFPFTKTIVHHINVFYILFFQVNNFILGIVCISTYGVALLLTFVVFRCVVINDLFNQLPFKVFIALCYCKQ